MEVSVLHGLKHGNEVLKEIHKELNVESVEKLLEETQEAREYQIVSGQTSPFYLQELIMLQTGDFRNALEYPDPR